MTGNHAWPALTLARASFAETLHGRAVLVALLVVATGVGFGQFATQLALADSAGIRIAIQAWLFRAAAVFLVAGFTIASVTREQDDKVTEMLLALPLSRGTYLAGKALGAALAAAALAMLFSLPLAADVPLAALAAWLASLTFELVLVALVSLLCVLTFGHFVPSLAAVAAFYGLSRSLGALLAIGASPVAPVDSPAYRMADALLHAIATLLPRLDQFTRTAWLLGEAAPWTEIGHVLVQAAVFASLAAAAAWIDFSRKSL